MKISQLAIGAVMASAIGMQMSAQAEEGWSEFRISGGAEFTSGSYGGTEDTDIFFVPVSASYETEKFRFKGTVSYLQIEGPGGVIGGDGGVVIGPGGGAVTSESGMGDTILAATYNLYPDANDAPFLELTGKVKLPTADSDKGLGTGEMDYSVQVDVFQAFGNVTPFGTVGYKLRGDPEGFDLNDSFFASAGAAVKMSETFSIGGVYDYRDAATDFADNVSEVSPFATFKVTDSAVVQVYGVFGLSDGSPDTGGGVQLRKSF